MTKQPQSNFASIQCEIAIKITLISNFSKFKFKVWILQPYWRHKAPSRAPSPTQELEEWAHSAQIFQFKIILQLLRWDFNCTQLDYILSCFPHNNFCYLSSQFPYNKLFYPQSWVSFNCLCTYSSCFHTISTVIHCLIIFAVSCVINFNV